MVDGIHCRYEIMIVGDNGVVLYYDPCNSMEVNEGYYEGNIMAKVHLP